jgi:hypothetical protein
VIPLGECLVGNSATSPPGVIRPTRLRWLSVNHRLPSGPSVMLSGPVSFSRVVNSVIAPLGEIRPIVSPLPFLLPLPYSVNQRLPSGPMTMSFGPLSGSGRGNSVTAPVGEMRAILSAANSVNHTFPSGPGAIPLAPLSAVGIGNSVIVPVGAPDASAANTSDASSASALAGTAARAILGEPAKAAVIERADSVERLTSRLNRPTMPAP